MKLILVILIIILALLTRLALLNIRPLHHDEGVNYSFAKQILETQTFTYNPLNYHGPLYFFILALSFALLGISEFSLRLPAAIFGILIILLPIIFSKSKNKYLASIFLILSPSLMYYSRYSIHESLFVLSTMTILYISIQVIETKSLKQFPILATALALAVTTKETITITILTLILIIFLNLKEIKKLQLKNQKKIILLSLIVFLVIYITFFTSFFTNTQGLIGSIKSYFPWLNRGFTELGHTKPWHYYLFLLLKYEFPILILAIIAIPKSLRNKNLFAKNLLIWLLVTLLIYSLISYKTPWLIINISVPMAILASQGIQILKNKKLKYTVITISIIFLSMNSLDLNFLMPWQSTNPFAYVHTDKDTLNLVEEINYNYQENSKILILSNEYWPLPFYLDKKNVMYLDQAQTFSPADYPEYDIFIVKDEILDNNQNIEEPENFKHGQYSLRKGIILHLFIKRNNF